MTDTKRYYAVIDIESGVFIYTGSRLSLAVTMWEPGTHLTVASTEVQAQREAADWAERARKKYGYKRPRLNADW